MALQGDEVIALPAIPPVEAVPPSPKTRRPSPWRRRFATVSDDLTRMAREIRRLFAYTRPYRGRLLLSWLATAGYAAAGALLVYMVKPIFDDVLIQNVNVAEVAFTILGLYLRQGALLVPLHHAGGRRWGSGPSPTFGTRSTSTS